MKTIISIYITLHILVGVQVFILNTAPVNFVDAVSVHSTRVGKFIITNENLYAPVLSYMTNLVSHL